MPPAQENVQRDDKPQQQPLNSGASANAVAPIAYGRQAPFVIDSRAGFVAVIGPRRLPFVVLGMVREEGPKPDSPDDAPAAPNALLGDTAPPPEPDAPFDPVPKPIMANVMSAEHRMAFVPCVGCGTWSIVAAFPRSVFPEGWYRTEVGKATFDEATTVAFAEQLRAKVPPQFGLAVFRARVPDSYFVHDHANAAVVSGALLQGHFQGPTVCMDRALVNCPRSSALLRARHRELAPDLWAFFLQRGQPVVPSTDKESAATRRLCRIPAPKECFVFDLRPKKRGEWSRYLENGYVREGRPAPAAGEADARGGNAARRRQWAKDEATRRDALRRVRITINRDFRGTLHRLREVHIANKETTWLDADYVEMMSELREQDSINHVAWAFAMQSMTDVGAQIPGHQLPASPTFAHIRAGFEDGSDADTDDGWDDSAKTRDAASDDADATTDAIAAALRDLPVTPAAFSDEIDAYNDEMTLLSRLERRLVNLAVFELWDAETDELLAATFGFRVGRAYYDGSMGTFVRGRAQYGHLLTHAVADVLQRGGVELWYWGKELPYMGAYRRTAGAYGLPIERFPLWRAVAAKSPRKDAPTLPELVARLPGAGPMPPRARRVPQPRKRDNNDDDPASTEKQPEPVTVIVAGAPVESLIA